MHRPSAVFNMTRGDLANVVADVAHSARFWGDAAPESASHFVRAYSESIWRHAGLRHLSHDVIDARTVHDQAQWRSAYQCEPDPVITAAIRDMPEDIRRDILPEELLRIRLVPERPCFV